jgi:hypothetical protein
MQRLCERVLHHGRMKGDDARGRCDGSGLLRTAGNVGSSLWKILDGIREAEGISYLSFGIL